MEMIERLIILSFLLVNIMPLGCMEQKIDTIVLSRQLQSVILRGEGIKSILKKCVGISSFNIDFVRNGCTPLQCAVLVRNIKAVQLLQEAGARVETCGEHGCTPLHFAAGCPKLMALLLTARANPNLMDEQGNTPLHWAARAQDKESAQLLIGKGAYYLKNYQGEYPALTWMNKELLEQLRIRSEAAVERHRNEALAADALRKKEIEDEHVRLQARAEAQAKQQEELRIQKEEFRREEKRKRDLAYAKHVQDVASRNMPEILQQDYWTGDILVLTKGSDFALWMRYEEAMKIINDPDYGSKSIFSAYRIHHAYCVNCPFAGNW